VPTLQVLIDRNKWIELAEDAEKAGAPLTCSSIIRATISLGVEKEDRKRTWVADAEVCMWVWLCRVYAIAVESAFANNVSLLVMAPVCSLAARC
jgi:hypothetical protein